MRHSLRQSIDDMCLVCIYDKAGEGTWTQQVTECTCYTCPLYRVRPITRGSIKDVRKLLKYQDSGREAYLNRRKRGE